MKPNDVELIELGQASIETKGGNEGQLDVDGTLQPIAGMSDD